MENENDKIMKRSMQDKMDKMHLISFEIIDVINGKKLVYIDRTKFVESY